ncbi:hypothetical protein [Streptomyces sp. NPDC093094]|uniref:hypothetical protein n=1 Tax=Streptomyces sp. NPDC093094 TaxID=3366026 RepID=UPI0038144907
MKSKIKSSLCAATTGTALLAGSFAVVPAMATPAAAAHCEPFQYHKTRQLGRPFYRTTGPTNSKYNSSSHRSNLNITVTRDTTRSTAWKVEAGGSLNFAIAEVKADFNVNITKTVKRGVKVTNTMVVDARKRGYTRPMVEYRKWVVEQWRQAGNCSQVYVKQMGILSGITSSMHWAECQTRSVNGCTPKP